MRIAVLSNAYPPVARGGAGRIAQLYVEALQARGHEVRVWGPSVAFARLGAMSPVSRLFFHIKDLRAHGQMVQDILARKPDILLTHNLTGCGFATPHEVARGGIAWFHVLHDVQLFEPSGQMMSNEGSSVLRQAWRDTWAHLRRNAMGKPRGVISPTQWLLDQHRAHGLFVDGASSIVPNPLSIPQQGSYERDAKAVLYAGRMDTDKGLGVLYAAWPRLREQVSTLILIGEGAWRKRFEDLKDDKVQVLGALPTDEVMRKMSSVGMVVVPSLVCENQSTVALEALAAGCEVVASEVGGMRETLRDCGTLFAAGDIDALIEACTKKLGSKPSDQQRSQTAALLADHEPGLAASRVEAFVRSNL